MITRNSVLRNTANKEEGTEIPVVWETLQPKEEMKGILAEGKGSWKEIRKLLWEVWSAGWPGKEGAGITLWKQGV